MNGEVLGDRYELLEKIGEGGMAIVYKARCNKLNRFVAVKILREEYNSNEDIVDKFKKEATAIATLSDNNIVNVLDVGSQDNKHYIVMEYVKGKTLKEVVEQFGKLSYESAITISLQVAKALDCAQRNNIVHRDIKPQNILVAEDGLVKVTDFGIAKSSSSATLTNTSTVLGSAHYFSPEQAKGSFVDGRTDIYSLGVVMYEMVTGKLPFDGDSPVTIALKHIQEEAVPPKSLNTKVPESLNLVILKCMEKDANKRYQSAKELISDLQKIKDNPDVDLIGNNIKNNQAQHTIVMNAVNVEEALNADKKTGAVNKIDEDYDDYDDEDEYDDEDYDDEDYDDDEDLKEKKSIKRLTIGIIVAVLIIAIGAGTFFILGKGKAAKEVSVPNFVGMSLDDAKGLAEKSNIKIQVVKETESDKKEGTVLSSDPKEGTKIKEGDTVGVTISGGKEKLYLPNLVEDGIDDAKNKLRSQGLTNIVVTYDYSDSIQKDDVISQNPKADSEVTKDTKITLVVSKGKKITKVAVPGDLSGLSEQDARNRLRGLGFKVNVETTNTSDENLNGKVVDINPKAGAELNEGETVTIQIGKYTEPEENLNDLVIGSTGDEAVAKLNAAGYHASLDPKSAGHGRVTSVNPGKAKKGANVVVTTDIPVSQPGDNGGNDNPQDGTGTPRTPATTQGSTNQPVNQQPAASAPKTN